MPSRRIAVAATGRQALEAGLGVVEDGGNAVDAALAAAFVAMATEPGVVSLGGGAFVAVWTVDGDPVVVDGNVEMPGRGGDPSRLGRGIREVVTDYGGGVTMHAGAGSVATPGIVPAFARAHADHARLSWDRLLAPAVDAARHGYPMSHAAARYLGFTADSLFALDPEARALTTRADGSPLAGGELATNEALADVLEQLGRDGAALFGRGAVGRALVAQMTAEGGLVTAEDLAAYTPVDRSPALVALGDWRLALNPPPAVGGPMLAAMLTALGERDRWDWADAIEIQRAVLGYRHEVHDYWAVDWSVAATPRDATEGLVQGITSFTHEFLGSMAGVVREPVVGAQKTGVRGAARGLASGLVNLIRRPIRGGFIFVDKVTAGVANQLQVSSSSFSTFRNCPSVSISTSMVAPSAFLISTE